MTLREQHLWGERYAADRRTGTTEAPHEHELAFLACVDAGLIELRTEHESWVVSPRSVTFVPGGLRHSVRTISAAVRGWIIHLPRAHATALGRSPHVVEMSDVFLALSARIVEWGPSRSTTPEQDRLIAVALDELRSARAHRAFRLPLPRAPGLLRVCDAVLAAPSDMSPIDRWVRLAAMSHRSFTRHFTEETGLPFNAWRHRVKIHEALRLFSDGASVTNVGFDLGYQSTSSFIAMFRKCTGRAPARFVKELTASTALTVSAHPSRERTRRTRT